MANSWGWQGGAPLAGGYWGGPLAGQPVAGPLNGRGPDFTEANDPVFALGDHVALRNALADAVARKRSGAVSVENIGRALARSVPVAGSFLDELDAATNATLAPLLDPLLPDSFEKLPEKTWQDRYNHALAIQRGKDTAFDTEHPNLSAGIQLGGGLAATIPLAATATGAKLLGLTADTLPRAVATGMASGLGLGAATGFGNGEGGFENRLGSAAIDGLIGAVLGGGVPVVGAMVR